MSFVVTEGCIKCKFTDCVDVCPVNCFYEGATMLVIHQDDCIDCGICEPECPIEAIVPDSHHGVGPWIELNRKYSTLWPNIARSREPEPDAERYREVSPKYPELFSPEPARTA